MSHYQMAFCVLPLEKLFREKRFYFLKSIYNNKARSNSNSLLLKQGKNKQYIKAEHGTRRCAQFYIIHSTVLLYDGL